MKKYSTIFIVVASVGLVFQQANGLTRKEFLQLRQLEKTLAERIKAGVQGETEDMIKNWWKETTELFNEIEQLDPLSAVPFNRKLTVLLKEGEWQEEEADKEKLDTEIIEGLEEIQGNIITGEGKLGVKQLVTEGFVFKDLQNGIGYYVTLINKSKAILGDDYFQRAIKWTDDLLERNRELAKVERKAIEKEIIDISIAIDQEKKKNLNVNFDRFENRIEEKLGILPFLEGSISDSYYNQLDQDLSDLLVKADQAQLAKKFTEEKNKILEDIQNKRNTMVTLIHPFNPGGEEQLKKQLNYFNQGKYLFKNFFETAINMARYILENKDIFTENDFKVLDQKIGAFKKDLAKNILINAKNLLLYTYKEVVNPEFAKVEDTLQNQQKINLNGLNNAVVAVKGFVAIASQNGIYTGTALPELIEYNKDLDGLVEKVDKELIRLAFAIFNEDENLEGLFQKIEGSIKPTIDTITSPQSPNIKQSVAFFNRATNYIRAMNSLKEMYSYLSQVGTKVDVKVSEMDNKISTLKRDLYNAYQVEKANEVGKIVATYVKEVEKIIGAGLAAVVMKEFVESKSSPFEDPLKDIKPSLQFIFKKQLLKQTGGT